MNFSQVIIFFYQAIKPYGIWYLFMILIPVFNAFCILFFNFSLKLTIDIFSKNNNIIYTEIIGAIIIFCLSVIIREFLWRLKNLCKLKADPILKKDIFIKVYKKVTKHSFSFFQNNLSGLIVSKIKGVCDGFFHIWDHISNATLTSLMSIIVSGFALLFINKNIFLLVFFFGLFFARISYKIFTKIRYLNQAEQEDYHKIIGFLGDRINNIFTIFHCASNNREIKFLKDYYDSSNIPKAKKNLRYQLLSNVLLSVLYLIFFIFIFFYLIYLKKKSLISIGDIAFTMTTIFTFIDNIFIFMQELSDVIRHYSDLQSSMTLILQEEEITNFEKTYQNKIHQSLKDFQFQSLNHLTLEDFNIELPSSIEYRNVSFGYNKNSLFNKFNLTIRGGEKVALVGHSGAGKSTLISLLLKNFFPQEGDIIINNKSIYDINTYSLRRQISFIPQEISLFHRSILENITYAAPEVSFENVKDVLQKVDLLQMIENLPDKYNTIVGERGLKLSGGEKQRIAIARALLKKSPILIIDEATSNLDFETENKIKKAIHNICEQDKNITIIFIAHRLSTIRDVDRIIVLKGGKIVEEGSFEDLITINGEFSNMWNHQ